MIGQVTIGKSFGGLVRYVMEKDESEILDQQGLRSANTILATQDFNTIRRMKPNVKNAVWHTSISFAYEDKLDTEKMRLIATDYLIKIGLIDNQYLIVRHHDTKHEHLHIISNRVGFDGALVSDKFCKNRTAQICDGLEKKYQLTVARNQGLNVSKVNDKVPLVKELKGKIMTAILDNLSQGVSDYDTLKSKLKTVDIELLMHVQKSGRVNGISFGYKKMTFKGSTIDKSFSYQRLLKRLSKNRSQDKEQENDQRRKN